MFGLITNRLRDLLKRDPWLAAKFAAVTISLGFLGKIMLFGAVEGSDVDPTYAQFFPTIPMMGMTFLAHRYLWNHRATSLWSHVGGHWSKSYGTQFVIGHGLFTLFAVQLGWQYLLVSFAIGASSAIATFTYNEWRVFRRAKTETAAA